MNFKEYNKRIKVNGHSVTAKVVVEILEDDASLLLDQVFENEDQRKAFVARIKNEELFSGCIVVEATALGLVGSDSLGACELIPNNMFNSRPFEKSVNAYLKDYGMEANALNELRKSIQDEAKLCEVRSEHALSRASEFYKFSKKTVLK